MEWVTEMPTAEGWYWMRTPGNPPEVVSVERTKYGERLQVWTTGCDFSMDMDQPNFPVPDIEPGTLWAGPLQPPPLPPAPPA